MMTGKMKRKGAMKRSMSAGWGRLVMVAGVFVCCSCSPSVLTSPQRLLFKPLLGSFPQAAQVTLTNGMTVYLLEDHELPLCNLTAIIRTGSIYEPNDKVGVAELTGVVMRTGGTRSFSAEQINTQLELIAGSVETGIGSDAGTAVLSVLTKDRELGLKIFAEVLRYPLFAQDKVDLAKKKKTEEIRRRNDQPQSVAFREFAKALYTQNPRGRVPTLKTIAAVTRKDLVEFHRRYFHPNNVILGVSGDFAQDELVARLEELFRGWEVREIDFPLVTLPQDVTQKSIYYAYKEIPQSAIVMGHLAVGRVHPDSYAFELLNFIIGGGGFTSRLMSEVRSRRGLAYSVGSIYSPKVEYSTFGTYCFTKSESTAQCISLISEILDEVRTRGITLEELDLAKRSIINNFIFECTSPAKVVGRRIGIAYDKLPQDFLETYRERIASVTVEEVNRVAQHYLHPERMIVMVVGNGDHFERPLGEFGKVTSIALDETF